MDIGKLKEYFYPVGVLWNMGNKHVREMMLKIGIMEDVIQVRVYDLEDVYDKFVLECYEGDNEAYEDGYIYEKINSMKSSKSTKVVVFIIQIETPTYTINRDNGSKQCVQARKIKQKIRDEYSTKIKDYFFDNLIHMADNEEENTRVLQVLSRYEKYLQEEYVRKGYDPIIFHKDTESERKDITFGRLLAKLREISNER